MANKKKDEGKNVIGMFVQAGCFHCTRERALLREQIKRKEIHELPVEVPKWMELAVKHQIRGTPTVVLLNKLDGKDIKVLEKCSLEEFKKSGRCVPEQEEGQ